mmetsp:Transcript_15804/g.24563  ORF Transcript_15804/g.24563 Transcript_15804/m.24563 type:complete len:454 (-) Transcript_15804:115-1476(-)
MVMRKVASSPIITISALSPRKKNNKMMYPPSSRRCSSNHTSNGGLHRRQITPDSVVGEPFLCSHSFTDDYKSSSPSAGTTAIANNNDSGGSNSNNQNSLSSSRLINNNAQIIEHQSLQLLSILTLESSPHYATSPHYLHSSILLKDTGVSEKCRRKTCEWMYELCDYFQLQREVVGIALFYVDRYFTITFGSGGVGGGNSGTTTSPVTKRDFQLVGLTALYIAIKTHGQSRPSCLLDNTTTDTTSSLSSSSSDVAFNKLKFSLHVCASTSREQFTARQIEECECRMLQTLEWRLNPIVPSGCVIELLVVFLPSCVMMMEDYCEQDGGSSGQQQSVVQNFVYDCATYLTELAVSVAALSLVYKPSVIAYASVLAALDILLEDDSSPSSSSSSSRVTKDTIIEYDAILNQASYRHFEMNKNEVLKAKEILGVMSPNVSALFPSPFGDEPSIPRLV